MVLRPNTNQFWIYDNTNDVFINPPSEVLDKYDLCTYTIKRIAEEVMKEVEKKPDWLFDTGYWYSDIEI